MPALCVTALLLAGCGSAGDEPTPGEMSVGEARALDEAAQMLESRRLTDEAPSAGEPTATPTGE